MKDFILVEGIDLSAALGKIGTSSGLMVRRRESG